MFLTITESLYSIVLFYTLFHLLHSDPASDEYEVGVHIADVSHFVRPGSQMDAEAARRCTTVYLPDRNFPMLPRKICDELCSLNPGEDKLSYSVIFRVKEGDASLVTAENSTWIGRTAIRSCCKLNYGEAQKVLNEAENKDGRGAAVKGDMGDSNDALSHPKVYDNHTWSEIRDDLVRLAGVTRKLREQRFIQGSIRLSPCKMSVKESSIFGDSAESKCAEPESEEDAKSLIEELMLMANKIVADRMVKSGASELAVLRYHPAPLMCQLRELTQYLR